MEVHHHSHTSADPGSHRGRKKWTHYLWEFLMLFLAVTLGFFVENQREHYIEHQREKKFAGLLYEDFKKDAVFISQILALKEWRNKKIDTLFSYLSQSDLQANANRLYYYTAFTDLNIPFKPGDATIQQLRNSGTLRYFSNPGLYNAITKYYSDCSFYFDAEFPVESNVLMQEAIIKLFDGDKLTSLIMITPDIKDAVSRPAEPLQLLTTDKQLLNEFKYRVRNVKLNNDLTRMLLGYIKTDLEKLIQNFEKEYHLK